MTEAIRTDPPSATKATDGPYRWRWMALLVVLSAEVMDLLDATVTNIASPSIRADLGGSYAVIQWLGAGYTLAMAIGLLTGGRLGDIFGRRRMFLIGAAGFTLSSVLCGLSQDPTMIILCRVLQGGFGAVMLPQGLGVIKEVFDEKEMAKAFGMFGPVMGLAAVAGPILAGWLIDADLFGTGWRMIFLINVPLGLLALCGAVKFLPRSRSPQAPRLDVVGAILATVASFLIIYPLVQGRESGWPVWTFAAMAGSALTFGVFAWYELRVRRRGADPLIVPGLFRKRAFSGGLLFGVAFFSGMIGFQLVFNLYMQLGLGYSPLKAGLAGSPWAVGVMLGFGMANPLQKYGRRLLQGGALVMIVGVIGIYLTLRLVDIDITPWHFIPALLVTGIGMGMLMMPFFDTVLSGVEQHETGSASGALTAVQQLGAALGVAVLGTIFFGLLGGQVTAGADRAAVGLRSDLAAASVPAPAQNRIVAGLRACAHDHATADDPAAVPASCTRARSTVRATIAANPGTADRVGAAVARATEQATERGFAGAMKIALWTEVGLLGLAFLLAFLLPRQARPQDGPTEAATAT